MYTIGGDMPLLQIRDFPDDVKVNANKERRLQSIENSKKIIISEKIKKIDPVKWIREDRNR